MANLKPKSSVNIPMLIMLVLFAASAGVNFYQYKKYKDYKVVASKTTEQKNKEYIDKIGKVYQLPSGEEPVVLNVNKDPKDFTTDQEKAFSKTFKDLAKGDIVLLYEKAGLAIQYRESSNKVISTASLAIKSATSVAIIAPTTTQESLASTVTAKLGADVKVGTKSTPSGQYTATTVVDLTGQKPDIAKRIAESINATVASVLPSAEKTPEGAEIVIIGATN
jgi:phage gp45-like